MKVSLFTLQPRQPKNIPIASAEHIYTVQIDHTNVSAEYPKEKMIQGS